MVAQILHDIDPEASSLRKKKKLKQQDYVSHGPNQCWHIGGKFSNISTKWQEHEWTA